MKKFFWVIVFLGVEAACADGLGLPTKEQLEQDGIQTEFPDNNLPQDWDTRLPEPGKIRMLAEVYLRKSVEGIEAGKAAVPEGPRGKESVLYAKIEQWREEATLQLESRTRVGALNLNPLSAEIYRLAKPPVTIDRSVRGLFVNVHNASTALVFNMADFLFENPQPTVAQHNAMISCFSHPDFIESGSWEDVPMLIDPAGIFITDAANATITLKTKPLEEIDSFFWGYKDISFFERYEAGGDGMDLLKAKYAANKAEIHAKFAEVLAYAAQLQPLQHEE